MQKIIVVDCYNLGHIAFHSMGDLDYHGRRTGVIFGFLNKILLMAKTFETNKFIFAWDSRQSLRKLIYEPYKEREVKLTMRGTDEVMDYAALHKQMDDLMHNVLRSLGFTNVLLRAGFEADDVIAAVVKHATFHPAYLDDDEVEFIIASTDRDLYQLLTPNVCMYKIRSKKTYTVDDFREEYNIEPRQWAKAKAMGGCDSDHVQGIKGIADPAKSTRSRALQIIRGELTKGRYVDEVKSNLGQFIIKRNLGLVKLPFAKFPVMLTPDTLTSERFITMFDMLGFTSFLPPNQKWDEWEEYFEFNTQTNKALPSKCFGVGQR